MKLTQEQRDEIRFALEDAGMPEVLAFMAGQIANKPIGEIGDHHGKPDVWNVNYWGDTPQGHDFWMAVAADFGQERHPWGA